MSLHGKLRLPWPKQAPCLIRSKVFELTMSGLFRPLPDAELGVSKLANGPNDISTYISPPSLSSSNERAVAAHSARPQFARFQMVTATDGIVKPQSPLSAVTSRTIENEDL